MSEQPAKLADPFDGLTLHLILRGAALYRCRNR
jgi:hypothetical protein